MSLGSRLAPAWLRRFAHEERGTISVWSLFLFLTAGIIGGFGVDVTQMFAMRTQLQVAADVAAHGALYRRNNGATEAQAKNSAILVASATVPPSIHGTVIDPAEIIFGFYDIYDRDADLFREVPNSTRAVFVRAERQQDQGNPVGTFLLRLAGIGSMDVGASAVYVAEGNPCAQQRQGLFGQGQVRIRSRNDVGPGVCFHSNDVVVTSDNNDLQYTATDPLEEECEGATDHAILSMPDPSRLPNGNNNECIREAKRTGSYDLAQYYNPLQGATTGPALLAQVDQVMALMPAWSWTGIDRTVNTVTGTSLPASAGTTNRVTYVNCNGGSLTLSGTFTRAVLLLNNCRVQVNSNQTLTLSDTVLYNTNTNNNTAFNFGSGANAAKLVLGDDMDCDGTGASYLLTRGGFDGPAKMTLNNGTIVARQNVQFAAQFGGADRLARGISIIAGGTIDTTSGGVFNPCPPPAGTPPVEIIFRLAR